MSTVKVAIVAVLFATLGVAEAGELADAFARSDIKALRARAKQDDVAARCTLGAIYAKQHDLARAHLYLMTCSDAQLPDDIAPAVARAAREVAKQLRDSDLSSIVISVQPDGVRLAAEISALPGETFTAPATIWVKAGTHELTATTGEQTYKQSVSVREFSRTSMLISASPPKATAPKDGSVSFDDEAALEQESGPPPAVKRGSLMSKKYLGVAEGPAGDLVDPLAYRPQRYTTRPLWLGLRLGGGMFDDSALDARAGAAVAATLRYYVAPRTFLAARLDYSRRGGDGASIDTLGASAGAGLTLTPTFAVLAQLRGDARFTDVMGVDTVGASGALGLEFALPHTPLAFGARFEQGLTELAPDTRDRAVLVEVGVDWR